MVNDVLQSSGLACNTYPSGVRLDKNLFSFLSRESEKKKNLVVCSDQHRSPTPLTHLPDDQERSRKDFYLGNRACGSFMFFRIFLWLLRFKGRKKRFQVSKHYSIKLLTYVSRSKNSPQLQRANFVKTKTKTKLIPTINRNKVKFKMETAMRRTKCLRETPKTLSDQAE